MHSVTGGDPEFLMCGLWCSVSSGDVIHITAGCYDVMVWVLLAMHDCCAFLHVQLHVCCAGGPAFQCAVSIIDPPCEHSQSPLFLFDCARKLLGATVHHYVARLATPRWTRSQQFCVVDVTRL
eukprot:scpid91506/ scgid33039/ 